MQSTYNAGKYEVRNPALPILFVSGSDDAVLISEEKWFASQQFLRDVGYRNVSGKLYHQMRHEILNEIGKEEVYADLLAFAEKDGDKINLPGARHAGRQYKNAFLKIFLTAFAPTENRGAKSRFFAAFPAPGPEGRRHFSEKDNDLPGAGIPSTRREIFFLRKGLTKLRGCRIIETKWRKRNFFKLSFVSRGGYMAKKKTSSLLGLILMAVAVVGAVLAVVGVFTDWVKYVVEMAGREALSEGITLKELAEFSTRDLVLSYITMILSIVSAALLVLVKFLKMGILRPITGLAGLLTVVSAVLMIVFTIMFCSKNANFSLWDYTSGKYTWDMGAILASIGGVIAGRLRRGGV